MTKAVKILCGDCNGRGYSFQQVSRENTQESNICIRCGGTGYVVLKPLPLGEPWPPEWKFLGQLDNQ